MLSYIMRKIILLLVILMETTNDFVVTDPYADLAYYSDTDILVFSYNSISKSEIEVVGPEPEQNEGGFTPSPELKRIIDLWSKFR